MTRGYQALSEKEKETLRLLVNGYDAKSMARHLGLSVHTINERLREARSKMAVSSSREAARLMREIERSDPEFLVPQDLGDAATAGGMRQLRTPDNVSSDSRRFRWVIGGALMPFALALLVVATMSDHAQTPTTASQSVASSAPAAESAAVGAARQWLALIDKGDWNASWEATGQAFKALNTVETWASVSEQVRPPLGALKSRELLSEQEVPAPPYGYLMVKFRTDYANKAGAIETLSLVREGGAWRVVGVTIE